jgi:hypothetical protein
MIPVIAPGVFPTGRFTDKFDRKFIRNIKATA